MVVGVNAPTDKCTTFINSCRRCSEDNRGIRCVFIIIYRLPAAIRACIIYDLHLSRITPFRNQVDIGCNLTKFVYIASRFVFIFIEPTCLYIYFLTLFVNFFMNKKTPSTSAATGVFMIWRFTLLSSGQPA